MNSPSNALSAASLSALTEAAAAITSTLDLQTVLQTIARLACQVAHAEASSVFSLDPQRAKLAVVAATGRRRDALLGQEFDARQGIPGLVLGTGTAICIPDVTAHSRFSRDIDDIGSFRTRTLMAAPMVHQAQVIGVIEVVNRLDGTDFAEADLKVLQLLATFAASASHNARAHEELQRRYDGIRESVSKPVTIVGESAAVRRALELCDRVGPSNATVLLSGETGTGKELCARYIHNMSRRSQEPFIGISCAALPEALLESELFGHEKGAFTSAHTQRKGWFELAGKGTLFLDEIGEISRSTQAKLLRVLQEREFTRIGGTRSIRCDVRIIAATNRRLKNMMIDGLFREDLYYRLSVFPIQVPPLRDRREDIPRLVAFFMERAARGFGIPPLTVSREAMDMLMGYRWPGNIRELENLVGRSVLMADGSILRAHQLPLEIQAIAQGENASLAVNNLHAQERALILKVLQESDWNQSRAARVLGISRDYLRHRMKRYQLRKPDIPAAGQDQSHLSQDSKLPMADN